MDQNTIQKIGGTGGVLSQLSSNLKLALSFITGVVITLLVMWGISAFQTNHNSATQKTATIMATSSADQSKTSGSQLSSISVPVTQSGSLIVSSQPAGLGVEVKGISVSVPTWIVVYDDNNGKPSNTLGAALVLSGEQNVIVPLLRTTVSGSIYLVGESSTNAGSHTYSRTTTQPLNIWTTFTAQ